MKGSGDGWTTCGLGHRHWGPYGAAGLLLRSTPRTTGDVLLQHRAGWTHNGDTWGLPGGARDRDESAVRAAVREAAEEVGLEPSSVRPEAVYVDDHGGWTYTTVVAATVGPVHPHPSSAETADVGWVAPDRVDDLPLHPGFACTWPQVRAIGAAPVLVVDAANVIGSRPDGWWTDRAGAVRRLRDALAATRAVVRTPNPATDSDPALDLGVDLGLDVGLDLGLDLGAGPTFPAVVLVTEGATRGVEAVPGVEVVAAPGSGDDTIVALAARPGERPVVVVTADRELRRRVEALGATTLGPRSLLDQLPR